ncbi:hypothetical protein HMPREF0972_00482 [Actinomyces sp. oral taxon 848 str. F0332]|nr:hypothetical protein HMPREF0972_00482 [Actinomyces sp. oral taxon 848 str. F0332]
MVGSRFFQRIEFCSMQVLKESVSKQILILRMPNNGGNGLNACQLRGTPTALAHDEFVASF